VAERRVSVRTALVLTGAALVFAFAAIAVLSVPTGRGAIGSTLARKALVPRDVRAAREAEALFARSRGRAATVADAVRRREAAEAALTAVADGGGAPAVRSRAGTLLALLLLDDARQDRSHAPALVGEALARLRAAVRLDPANDAGAVDLELLLASRRRDSKKAVSRPAARSAHRSPRNAASSPPGSGY